MRSKYNRLLAFVLAMLLCLSAADTGLVYAFAEDNETELTQTEQEAAVEETEEETAEEVVEEEAAEEVTEEETEEEVAEEVTEEEPEEEPEEDPVEEVTEEEPEEDPVEEVTEEEPEEVEEEVTEEETEFEEETDDALFGAAFLAEEEVSTDLTIYVTNGQISEKDLVKAIRDAYGPSTATRYYISTNPNASSDELKVYANLTSDAFYLEEGVYYAYTKNLLTGKPKLAGGFTVVETNVVTDNGAITLKNKIGTVTIPYDANGINAAQLQNTLFDAMYESSDPVLTAKDVTFTYIRSGVVLPLLGSSPVSAGTYTVIMTMNGDSASAAASVKFADPSDVEVTLKKGAAITYNMDLAVMRAAILENIDWSVSTLTKNMNVDDLIIEYKASSDLLERLGINITSPWINIDGGLLDIPMGAGTHELRIRNKSLLPLLDSGSGTLTVNKAKASVKISASSIYANQPLPSKFITVTPNDPEIGTVSVFVGTTSDISTAIFVDLPVKKLADNKFIKVIDPLLEKLIHISFVDIVNNGITVGELRQLVNSEQLLNLLDLLGYDSSVLRSVLKIADGLHSVTDNVRITLNSPNRAGIYSVTCFTTNSNYTTAVGKGTLLVKMVSSGVKLVLNEALPKSMTAAERANYNFGVTVMLDGAPAPWQDNIHVLFSGVTSKLRIYSSSKMPTEPGSYIVTITTIGGSYFAAPVTKTFKITK